MDVPKTQCGYERNPQGTVVVEASSTSGAKMQARLALEHGKRVFLLKSLVTAQPWAQDYVKKRGALEVENIDDILRRLTDPAAFGRSRTPGSSLSSSHRTA